MKTHAFVLVGVVVAQSANAGTFYPDVLVDFEFITVLGTGTVTGPPDDHGVFLSDTFDPPTNLGFITVEFFTPLIDGPGDDLKVVDMEPLDSDPFETADVYVSANGVDFTFVGSVIGGHAEGFVDINGAFVGPFTYVKVQQTGTTDSIDIDTIAAFNNAGLPCIGDLNGDNSVGPTDLAVLLGNWGPNPGHPADLNDDGEVNAADLAILLGSWGPCR